NSDDHRQLQPRWQWTRQPIRWHGREADLAAADATRGEECVRRDCDRDIGEGRIRADDRGRRSRRNRRPLT
ncbi:MAG: hypothetical protein L0Z50_19570, partial [Verrucomicrobiales bacterium]|nr:hypothetical protein [Verrucomicrobiales bacterium]